MSSYESFLMIFNEIVTFEFSNLTMSVELSSLDSLFEFFETSMKLIYKKIFLFAIFNTIKLRKFSVI